MFDDLVCLLNASRGLSAIAEFLVFIGDQTRGRKVKGPPRPRQ